MPCMRYRDRIGLSDDVETAPGVWQSQIVERVYSGDVVKYSSHFVLDQNRVNPTPQLRNQISVLGDPYLFDRLPRIRYAWFYGHRFKVTSTEIDGNRLILDLGELYTDEAPSWGGDEDE